jgi:zinc transport system substrate-binding protein
MATVRRLAAAAAAVSLAAGCTSNSATPVSRPIPVAATPFALAEVARRVGLDRVTVSDHGEVVLVDDADAWLDPVAMEQVTQRVADTLSRHDPAGRPAYEAAARAFQAQLGALDIDYRSSLADCARHGIVTADGAFAPMARRYSFVDRTAEDPGIAEAIRAAGITVVFTEDSVADGAVRALAQATHARVDQLDTTVVRTPEEVARGATYLSLMADNLAKLRTALACSSG